jgi:hypothetical protein
MPGSLRIGRIFGIDIYIHFSWLIIIVLMTWSLAIGWFPMLYHLKVGSKINQHRNVHRITNREYIPFTESYSTYCSYLVVTCKSTTTSSISLSL